MLFDARAPRATYRLQLHAGFTLHDAADLVPYLAELGVSHVYSSPILRAAAGSTHGYDVVDHGRIGDEIGGDAGFARLTDALRAQGMGLVVDIVPNHMAVADENAWWWDVLEHGPASAYASWFDVDWEPPEHRLRNVILLPILPDHYGRVLESGGITLERHGGRIVACHGGRTLPLDPRTFGPIMADAAAATGSDELAFIATALEELPPSTTPDLELRERRRRDAAVLLNRLDELAGDGAVAAAIDEAVARRSADVDELDAVLEAQNYRLASWRSAARDLGYRRFFDVDDLVGLRTEEEEVFVATHALVLRWVEDGLVDGLRIDHPDGLREPARYLRRLRAAAPDAWIVVEKILEPGERLPDDWAVDGTTGYRFANLATGLLVDPAAAETFDRVWEAMAGEAPASWEEIALESRRQALVDLLGSDLNRLAELFLAVCEANRRYRDFTRFELHETLLEVAVALPVYRTYVRADDGHVTDVDRALVAEATARAARRRPDIDGEVFEFLGRILVLGVPGEQAGELAMRFQQLTPAAMAKGVEDTAFYRFHRLVALNEVGGDPGTFGTDVATFHAEMASAARDWPRAMLGLSTHDTKRSADVRARLATLTEDAAAWRLDAEALVASLRAHAPGEEPSDADLYLLVQTLVGAWPIDADRAAAYLRKAIREAKQRTSWTAPDDAYEAAAERTAREALADDAFRLAVERVVASIEDASRRASLAMLAVQLTAPGIPDIYQGSELWDRSLVDPDNRRAVDYELRRRLLALARTTSAADAWADPGEGLPKLWLLRWALDLRARRPGPFAGGYQPLDASGPLADAVLAFARAGDVVTVVPIRPRRAAAEGWRGTTVALPAGRWRGLDGSLLDGTVEMAAVLADFPVAILERVA